MGSGFRLERVLKERGGGSKDTMVSSQLQSLTAGMYTLWFFSDPTYFPGRAAKIFYRPRKGTETKEPTPLLEDPEVMNTASSKKDESAPLPTTSPATTTTESAKTKAAEVVSSITSTIKNVLPSKGEPVKTGLKEGSAESTHPPRADGVIEIGSLGILHPSVLEHFEIPYPCSALEFDLAPFVKEERPVWA